MLNKPHKDKNIQSRLHYVESNMMWAILVTLCCCPVFGVVAIVYSSKVSDLVAAGEYIKAQNAAKASKKWCLIGIASWFLILIGYIFTTSGAIR